MRTLPMIAVALTCLSLAYAQTPEALELRGVVYEAGLNIPLADTQVTVYQFSNVEGRTVLTNLVTDGQGAFRLRLARPGDYYVEAAKASYVGRGDSYSTPGAPPTPASTTGTLITLNHEHPFEDLRLELMRFGEITGKVVDVDDKPLSGLSVELTPDPHGLAPGVGGTMRTNWKRLVDTGPDGTFQATQLVPGKYLVRVSPRVTLTFGPNGGARVTSRIPLTAFTEEDEKAVDETFQTTYWPDAAEQTGAATITVNPATTTELGTMRVRKERLYRVHLLARGCEAGDHLTIDTEDPNGVSLDPLQLPVNAGPSLQCQDLLLPGLRAGSYQIVATTSHSGASLPVDISDRNQALSLTLVPNSDILGRVVTMRDAPFPKSQSVLGVAGGTRIVPDAAGNFTLTGMPCRSTPIQMAQVAKGYYVRELRINGETVPGEFVSTCGGSRLEIVLDDKVASLTISVTDGDKPASSPVVEVQKWPPSRLDSQRPAPKPNESGRYQITDLSPGEYRVLAVRDVSLPDGATMNSIMGRMWDRATKVTVAPGEAKAISVKLTDPFQ